ncbi:hypothetical protein GCM10022252_20000 [Streptosporangium oxazolinicum]|uniref:Uncharacterized protein n=1 Tax=Streptosporangium oxazolinicum TaxID=909287 RepID=A0ABP8AP36_9ACTN
MLDFSYGAYPHRDGLAMKDGNSETKGVTIRREERADSTVWETHEAYIVHGERVRFIGTAHDVWAAFAQIEQWYAAQDNYYLGFDAA